MALMKMDVWLMRWLVPFVFVSPFITVPLVQMGVSQFSMFIAFIAGVTLVQMDEKMNIKRFLHALPIPTKMFLPARSLVLVLLGSIWLLFETVAMHLFGMGDAFNSHPAYHIAGQLTILFVLAPVIIGILTLIRQPIVKWATLFFAYIVIMVVGSIVTFLGQGLMDYFGSMGFLLAIGFVLVGILLFWLLTIAFSAIHARQDLV
jgi:hypothetical protein